MKSAFVLPLADLFGATLLKIAGNFRDECSKCSNVTEKYDDQEIVNFYIEVIIIRLGML